SNCCAGSGCFRASQLCIYHFFCGWRETVRSREIEAERPAMGSGAERSTATTAPHRQRSWGPAAAATSMWRGADSLLLLTLLLTTRPTMSLAQSAVQGTTTEAYSSSSSSSSSSDVPPTMLTKSAIAYNDDDGDALGNDDDEPEPFPEPLPVRRSTAVNSAAAAYNDDDGEALGHDDETFLFSNSTATSYSDTSTYDYCDSGDALCGTDDLCQECQSLTTSGGSLTCREAYPAAAASGDSSACEQLAATFCCYYGDASTAQRCLGNKPTALYWECVLTGAAFGCSLEDMPCYSAAQTQPIPSPSPTEAATMAPVQFGSGGEMESVFTASPTGAPTTFDRGSSLAGTASPTPAAPIASEDGDGGEAPAATRSPVAGNDDTGSGGIGAGSGFNSAGTSSGGGDFDGAAEGAGDGAARVAWSTATAVPRAVVTLGVTLFLAARHSAAK
ncbi:unnamed protein product, partial [Ectocarpus sp. 6 AP-2014]